MPMEPTRSLRSRDLRVIFALALVCSAFPGTFSLNVITLQSMMIFTSHDWLPVQPTIFFRCMGENMTILPDVKETNILYTFKGEESWQPLTVLPKKKCKRCGLYERDSMKADDTFDEWELCPGDFFNGMSTHSKKNEFNATFRSTFNESNGSFGKGSVQDTDMEEEGGSMGQLHLRLALVVIIGVLVFIAVVAGMVSGYKYWQKRKRESEQARFLKIFEDNDEIDELNLGTIV